MATIILLRPVVCVRLLSCLYTLQGWQFVQGSRAGVAITMEALVPIESFCGNGY